MIQHVMETGVIGNDVFSNCKVLLNDFFLQSTVQYCVLLLYWK